jgi:hypothetical protein
MEKCSTWNIFYCREYCLIGLARSADAWTASVLLPKFVAYFDRRIELPNDRNRRSLDYARDDKFVRFYVANFRDWTLVQCSTWNILS